MGETLAGSGNNLSAAGLSKEKIHPASRTTGLTAGI
jgi:hypothetical protein